MTPEDQNPAQTALNNINRAEWEFYKSQGGPMIEGLEDTLGDTSSLGQAQQNIQAGVAQAGQTEARNLGRYGATLNTSQRAARKKALGLGAATTTANTINSGLMDAKQQRRKNLTSMMGVRQNLVEQAQHGLGQSANMANQREMDYQNRRASAKAQNTQMATSAAMGLLMLSSREYKENIESYQPSDALHMIEDIDLVQFDYKPEIEAPRGTHIGVIAEDIPEILASEDQKGVNAYNMIGVLLGAVQELSKQVQELKGEQ